MIMYHQTKFECQRITRHRNWKKCLGSTEPKWPGSRGHLGPGGVQGQCPAGVFRVAKPPGRKRIWVFWRPVCSPSVHRNCENHSFVFALKLKHQNQHFITFSVTPTNFFKNYQHKIRQPRSQNLSISFGTL